MGNRAVITTKENFENNGVGVYLHWNGGRDSVEAFLKYCQLKGYRSPSSDCYGWARLCQVIGNFFGGANSVGIDVVNRLDCDNKDNGVYIIEGWNIVGREYFDWYEQDEYSMEEMLRDIDDSMPEDEQLGDYLTAPVVSIDDIKVGDTVTWINYAGGRDSATITGYGNAGKIVNGHDVSGVPYFNGYNLGENNINNYLNRNTEYRIIRRV